MSDVEYLLVVWLGGVLLFGLVVGLTLLLHRTRLGKRPQDPLSKQFKVIAACLVASAMVFSLLRLAS